MKSSVTNSTDTEATLTVNVSQDAFAPIVRRTFDQLRGRVKAAGFRPGKAPDHIVERELGSSHVQNDVLEAAVGASYAQAVKEHSLAVIAPPKVNITKFVPYTELEYTATVPVMPKIQLADYKKIKKRRPKVEVQEAEVDRTIEDLRQRLAKKPAVDRAAKAGDEVVIDFEGSKDGAPVPGASAEDHTLLLGSNSFIPGFEEQLVGLKAGESKRFEVTFPQDYRETSLAGQKVTFQVSVKEVREVVLPEINDSFAAEIGPFTAVAALRQDIAERIRAEKADEAARAFEQSVLDEIVDGSKLKTPPHLVDRQIERQKAELSERLAGSGLDIDKYLGLTKQTLDKLEDEMRPRAERQVAVAMVLSRIAQEENLTVTPAEVDQELERLRTAYPDQQVQTELKAPHIKEEIYNHLMTTKTVGKVLEYVEGDSAAQSK
ncbi:trigger factor [Candidatus Parcubacteria bacterium]|nr:trigger factor [Candidatus Parcubacteria bacterium]